MNADAEGRVAQVLGMFGSQTDLVKTREFLLESRPIEVLSAPDWDVHVWADTGVVERISHRGTYDGAAVDVDHARPLAYEIYSLIGPGGGFDTFLDGDVKVRNGRPTYVFEWRYRVKDIDTPSRFLVELDVDSGILRRTYYRERIEPTVSLEPSVELSEALKMVRQEFGAEFELEEARLFIALLEDGTQVLKWRMAGQSGSGRNVSLLIDAHSGRSSPVVELRQ